ncbi:MAG: DUF6259 domain-containing protein [Candidatus Poribacteria bacterium]|nr:DUF6259 domain-containing protein [Candidatus Poribacteria bacterium]
MRNIWNRCVYIVILQFVFVSIALANTLTVDEAGNVLAETERYVARFENGVLMHFHNKLTQETYTQGNFQGNTEMKAWGRGLGTADFVPDEIKRHSPLECELIYQDNWTNPRDNTVMLHLLIGIDVETGDLLIQQKGISETGGIEHIIWGFANFSHAAIDVILPTRGGRMISNDRNFADTYYYPGSKWEAQLAIFQGKRGGVFVRSNDTQYHFKTLQYVSEGESFAVNFGQHPSAPFEAVKQVTTVTWRLNAYEGDWQVPALHHRQWMHEALKPADRRDMPAWINNIDLIVSFPFYHSDMEAGILEKLSQLVDPEKTLLYVIDWRESGWALNYPDYTPVTSFANFGDFVREAHRYGFRVMPHVDMVGVSLSNPLYAVFEKYQMYHPGNGKKIGWALELDGPHPYAWINPASSEFRKMLVERVKSVWETYRVDAFHLDISHYIVNNAPIDGLTMAEGNILLHQELREAMPGIVLGGEGLHEVTFLYESLARLPATEREHPHAISSFLFSPYVLRYGHLGVPYPNRQPPGKLKENQEKYEVWNARFLLQLVRISDLDPDVETYRFLKLVGERQNYRFGDVNGDGVVNILDLTLVAQHIGIQKPHNPKVDINKDGVVNILDLTIVAQQID